VQCADLAYKDALPAEKVDRAVVGYQRGRMKISNETVLADERM
jgi:hypothetical protein